MTRLVIMRTVSVSELKAKLSQYLREVQRGGEVQVLDRGVPVARLVRSAPTNDHDAHRSQLISSGLLRPGTGDAISFLKLKPLQLKGGLSNALRDEREDRV